ncbi:hypothetical protein AMTRI_Chr09g39940 [Amborella trichopoda]
MSALFNFQSFLSLILLFICTCTYVKMIFPALLDRKIGFRGFFWKAARIGTNRLVKIHFFINFQLHLSVFFF